MPPLPTAFQGKGRITNLAHRALHYWGPGHPFRASPHVPTDDRRPTVLSHCSHHQAFAQAMPSARNALSLLLESLPQPQYGLVALPPQPP